MVIGGGITGAGVFREAVRMGFSTLLCETHDFAWGTSGRSSKLIHGGLRYLKQGRFFLTYDAVKQRQRLLKEAPGLIEPLGFMMPIYKDRGPGRASVETGLTIYDCMAGKRQHCYFDKEAFSRRIPGICEEGLVGGFHFQDAQSDDARLVLRLIAEGVAQGGAALNYTRAARIQRGRTGKVSGVCLEDSETKMVREISTRAVINATGAWAEKFHPSPKPRMHLRPLRGSHLVFPHWLLPINQAVTLTHPDDERPLFIIPWEGALMLGTTDLDHEQDVLRDPVMTREEGVYLLAALTACFPALDIGLADATAAWSGIRPVLSRKKKAPSQESRDHVVWIKDGMVTVTGGKLTTFRSLAQDAISAAAPYLPPTRTLAYSEPSFSPAVPNPALLDLLPRDELRRLYGRYGRLAQAILTQGDPSHLRPIPGTRTLWAELPLLAKTEQVRHLSDLLLRRVRIGLLLPQGGAAHLDRIQDLCAPMLSWSESRWRKERQSYLELWKRTHQVPA